MNNKMAKNTNLSTFESKKQTNKKNRDRIMDMPEGEESKKLKTYLKNNDRKTSLIW